MTPDPNPDSGLDINFILRIVGELYVETRFTKTRLDAAQATLDGLRAEVERRRSSKEAKPNEDPIARGAESAEEPQGK